MSPWIALLLFLIGNAILGSAVIMLVKGTMPPPMTHKRATPGFATFILLVGLTMMLHFGTPRLLLQLIEDVGRRMS